MIWGIFIFIGLALLAIYVLYKIAQIVGILVLGVMFVCFTSVIYITGTIAAGVLYMMFGIFGGENIWLLLLIPASVAILVGITLLKLMVSEVMEGKRKMQRWVARH
jgi:hypothetical protein